MKHNNKELICNCNGVLRGEITNAIRKHKATQLSHIQLLCGAGVRCGRCIPLIDEILLQEVKVDKPSNGQLRMEF